MAAMAASTSSITLTPAEEHRLEVADFQRRHARFVTAARVAIPIVLLLAIAQSINAVFSAGAGAHHLQTAPITSGVAIVTGGGGGIGREIAVALGVAGLDVVVAVRPSSVAKYTAQTASLWAERGATGAWYVEPVDLANASSVATFVERVQATYGSRLRILVNNAAAPAQRDDASVRHTTVDGMTVEFQVDVWAYWYLMTRLQPTLARNAPSSVVNIASTMATKPNLDDVQYEHAPFLSLHAYSAYKAADRMLTWEAAARYNHSGVMYNAIHPGVVAGTGMSPGGTLSSIGSMVDSPAHAAARAADLAQNATAFGYTATWWEMSTGHATVSEMKPCGSRKPFSFCDPHLRQRLWAYIEEVDAALTTRSHRRLAEAVVHGRRMPARFAKGHAPMPLQISGQESATPTARATYEFVEAAARGSHLGEPISDKVTSHSYETMYAQLLTPLHASVQASGRRLKLLEIGMGCDMERGSPGASTLLWTRLLPGAEVWQAELHGDCAKALGSKLPVRVLVGDQADPAVVREWVQTTGGGFDAIIDDGGHRNDQIKTSFDELWPALLPGGVYFVEDLHVSRASPHGPSGFTVVDRLHSWSEQLLSSRQTRKDAATAANHRAHREKAKHPMPSDVAFVFVQRDAAVIGKLTSAGRTAQQAHLKFPDIGGGPLRDADEQRALTTIVKAYRGGAEGAAGNGGEAALRGSWRGRAAAREAARSMVARAIASLSRENQPPAEARVCVLLTATTTPSVDLRSTSYGAYQQRSAHERQQMYASVLSHWRQIKPALPIVLVENSGDNLTWAKNSTAPELSDAERAAHLELRSLPPAERCDSWRKQRHAPQEIGCHEASAILRAVRASRLIGRGAGRCSHVLKVTGRYSVTSDVHAALASCPPHWDVAVQNTSWGAAHDVHTGPRVVGTMAFGFRADLTQSLFGWSQEGGACQECHINSWLRAHSRARVCQLPRLAVKPITEGSTGASRDHLR